MLKGWLFNVLTTHTHPHTHGNYVRRRVLISMIVIIAQCVRTQSITLYVLNTCTFHLKSREVMWDREDMLGRAPDSSWPLDWQLFATL